MVTFYKNEEQYYNQDTDIDTIYGFYSDFLYPGACVYSVLHSFIACVCLCVHHYNQDIGGRV